MDVTNVLRSGYFLGETARTSVEMPAIKAVSGIRKRRTSGRIAAARQKWLGMEAQAQALKTPQNANNVEPRRIRARAAVTRIIASGKVRSGPKLCGTANRWAMVRGPADSACGAGRANRERIFCVIISLSSNYRRPVILSLHKCPGTCLRIAGGARHKNGRHVEMVGYILERLHIFVAHPSSCVRSPPYSGCGVEPICAT
jgi:hypothetical protein